MADPHAGLAPDKPTKVPGAIYVGCAGWNLPRDTWSYFPPDGSHLARYAGRFNAAEINSSFHRPHQVETYARWAASVPPTFRFSVKLPKTISHEARLVSAEPLLDNFIPQVQGLGDRLGCLLVQLPPKLACEAHIALAFIKSLRERHSGFIAFEPRHASWFTPQAGELLQTHHIARVLADPVLHAAGERPGGWPGLVYCRLHGSPRMYYSSYRDDVLAQLAARITQENQAGTQLWCMFDNTASGAATGNALTLSQQLHQAALKPAAP